MNSYSIFNVKVHTFKFIPSKFGTFFPILLFNLIEHNLYQSPYWLITWYFSYLHQLQLYGLILYTTTEQALYLYSLSFLTHIRLYLNILKFIFIFNMNIMKIKISGFNKKLIYL